MQDPMLETENFSNLSTTTSLNEAALALRVDGRANCAALQTKHVRRTHWAKPSV